VFVCVCVCPSVCLWALSCLNRLTFDLDVLATGSTLTLASLGLYVKVVGQRSKLNSENCLRSPV